MIPGFSLILKLTLAVCKPFVFHVLNLRLNVPDINNIVLLCVDKIRKTHRYAALS